MTWTHSLSNSKVILYVQAYLSAIVIYLYAHDFQQAQKCYNDCSEYVHMWWLLSVFLGFYTESWCAKENFNITISLTTISQGSSLPQQWPESMHSKTTVCVWGKWCWRSQTCWSIKCLQSSWPCGKSFDLRYERVLIAEWLGMPYCLNGSMGSFPLIVYALKMMK
jgi:hypothetical protein